MKIKREETGESFASSTISESLELAPAEAPTECLSKNSALSARGTKKEASAAEVDCKTVRIFAYSSMREQSNKRSGMRLKTESETGERRYGRVRLARFARVRLLRHALRLY